MPRSFFTMAAGERSPLLLDINTSVNNNDQHASGANPNDQLLYTQQQPTLSSSATGRRKVSSSSSANNRMSSNAPPGPSSQQIQTNSMDGSYINELAQPDQTKYATGTLEEPYDEFISLPTDGELPPLTPCRVCGAMIDIANKRKQHVVKCDFCNEATPIRQAPPGQKYTRCPCNCLLICKARAQKISCPRPSCRRVIVLYTPNSQNQQMYPSEVSPVPGMCRVTCGHCEETFLFNSLTNQLARCPHCEKKSSVGRDFARARGLIFTILTLISLGIGIVVTIVTSSQVGSGQKGWIALYSFFYILAAYFILRSVYFLSMKTSQIQNTNP